MNRNNNAIKYVGKPGLNDRLLNCASFEYCANSREYKKIIESKLFISLNTFYERIAAFFKLYGSIALYHVFHVLQPQHTFCSLHCHVMKVNVAEARKWMKWNEKKEYEEKTTTTLTDTHNQSAAVIPARMKMKLKLKLRVLRHSAHTYIHTRSHTTHFPFER